MKVLTVLLLAALLAFATAGSVYHKLIHKTDP